MTTQDLFLAWLEVNKPRVTRDLPTRTSGEPAADRLLRRGVKYVEPGTDFGNVCSVPLEAATWEDLKFAMQDCDERCERAFRKLRGYAADPSKHSPEKIAREITKACDCQEERGILLALMTDVHTGGFTNVGDMLWLSAR